MHQLLPAWFAANLAIHGMPHMVLVPSSHMPSRRMPSSVMSVRHGFHDLLDASPASAAAFYFAAAAFSAAAAASRCWCSFRALPTVGRRQRKSLWEKGGEGEEGCFTAVETAGRVEGGSTADLIRLRRQREGEGAVLAPCEVRPVLLTRRAGRLRQHHRLPYMVIRVTTCASHGAQSQQCTREKAHGVWAVHCVGGLL